MSFIRMGQDSTYVELGEGSRCYIYSAGSNITTMTAPLPYSEWVGLLLNHASEAGLENLDELQRKLENYHGEKADDVRGYWERPEMAHILAQYYNNRLHGVELTDERREKLEDYAASQFDTCEGCGSTWRPDSFGNINERPDEYKGLCQDCYIDALMELDVSCDTSEMEAFIEGIDGIPTEEDDDEFYALTMDAYNEKDRGLEKTALIHQLGDIADEVQKATVKEEPLDKERVLSRLEELSDD